MKILNLEGKYLILLFIVLCISIGSVSATEDLSDYSNNDGESLSVNQLSSICVDSIDDNIENSNLSSIYTTVDDISLKNSNDNDIVSVSASKTKTVLSSKGLTMYYGASSSVVGYLKTSSGKAISGKLVKITINGKTYNKTTDSNGKVSLKISLKPNVYSTKFSFAGDSKYAASSCVVNVTVKKLSTKIIANDLHVYNNGNLLAYLKDSNNTVLANKYISFNINGISYSCISDSKGKVNFNIPNLEPDTYNVSLKFDGDTYYLASSLSVRVKVHEGLEINPEDIENLASDIVDYIEKNHKLPENISISNEKISISQYLSLISLDILNIECVYSSIFLENVSTPSSNENCKEGILDKANYIKLVKSVSSACSWGSAPNYISSSLGNIGFNSLVYTLSNILKSYSVYGVLPESVTVYPWSVVSNSKTSFITCDSILQQADYIKNYVESKHTLPSTVSINSTNSLVKINIAQFLKLELDLLVQLPLNSIQSFVLKTYKTAPNPSESVSQCSFNMNSYFDFAVRIKNFYETNGVAPNYVVTDKGNLGFESCVYLYSEILLSISKFQAFPSNINIVPWSVVKNKNNVFVDMNDIISMATTVRSNVLTKHTLPSSLSYSKGNININQFLYLETCAIENINNNFYQSIILKTFSKSPNPTEDIVRGKLLKSNYLNVATNIKNFLLNNGYVPNYAVCSVGKMDSKNSIFLYSEILSYFKDNNKLPDYVLINPWSILSNKNTIIFTPDQIINASYYIRDYIETNHTLPTTITVGAKSLNQNQILKLELATLHLINGSYAGSLVLDKYSSKSITDSLSSGYLNQKEYLDIARLIEYDMFYNDMINESTSLGKIGITNGLYIYSQILISYDNTGKLPDAINVKPWSIISNKNTKFVNIDEVSNVSKYIKNYIISNNSLPDYVTINGNKVDMANLAYILATSFKMIDSNLYTNIPLINFKYSDTTEENLTHYIINSDSYLTIANNLINYMDKNNALPNYLNTESGKIRYESIILLFATIFNYLNDNGEFLESTTIIPWNSVQSYKFFNIDDI
ncbi:MAG: Ig-like domain-containing protein, partial [archaeon]|nr:Ig-like domain-containing protein [archaeon]